MLQNRDLSIKKTRGITKIITIVMVLACFFTILSGCGKAKPTKDTYYGAWGKFLTKDGLYISTGEEVENPWGHQAVWVTIEPTELMTFTFAKGEKGVLILGEKEFPFTFKYLESAGYAGNVGPLRDIYEVNFESDETFTLDFSTEEGEKFPITVKDLDSTLLVCYTKKSAQSGYIAFRFHVEGSETIDLELTLTSYIYPKNLR